MFEPFGKSLTQLTIDDLQVLKERNVAEGLYIEYKSDFPNAAKISHSLASFANSYGGWYFVGITTNANNVPESFNGFSLEEHQNPKEKIRDVVRDHIDPLIHFESQLIELGNRRAILAVQVPESDDTPHVTKDGRIYRRNAEGSDPIAETNRLAIDRLYDKAKNLQRRIRRFCINDLTISRAEASQGWIEIYVMTYPFDKFYVEDFFRESHISAVKTMLESPSQVDNYFTSGIPFNNVYPALTSLTFRQTTRENLPFSIFGVTYRLYPNGNCKIVIPFPYINIENFETLYASSPIGQALLTRISRTDLNLFKIIDGFQFMTAFIVLLAKHIEYLKQRGWQDEIILVYRFEGTWRNILFLNSGAFRSQIERYGVPSCLQNRGSFPRFADVTYKRNLPVGLVELVTEFVWAAQHLGVFQDTVTDSLRDWDNYLRNLRPTNQPQ